MIGKKNKEFLGYYTGLELIVAIYIDNLLIMDKT